MSKIRRSIRAFQTGGALPDLEFASIRQPGVPLPVEEFGTLTGVLNQRFDQGLQLVEDQLAAATALQTAPFEEDRRRGDLLRESAISNLEEIQAQGDFENQVTAVRRLGNDFNRAAIPLLQRQAGFQQIVDQLGELNINAETQSDIINEIKRRENETPSIITTEEGITLNNFRPEAFQSLLAEDVDIAGKLDKLGRGFASDVRSSLAKLTQLKTQDGVPTGVPITVSGQTEIVDPDEVEALLDSAVESDRDIQAYLERERQLGRGEEAEAEIENLKDGVADKFGFRRTKFQQQFVPRSAIGGGAGDSNNEAIIRTNATGAFAVRDSQQYTQLSNRIKQLRQSGDPASLEIAANLESARTRFDEQALAKFGPKDRELYQQFSALTDEELDRISIREQATRNNPAFTEEERIEAAQDVNRLYRFRNLQSDFERSINESVKNVTPLSREATIFSADAEGLGKASTGRLNTLLAEDIDSQNYSVVEGFGAEAGRSFNDVFRERYIENDEFEDYTNIRFEARNSDGISLEGIPFSNVSILGDIDGRTQRIGEHLVSESREEAWRNRERLGRALAQDGELDKAALIQMQVSRVPNGRRLGEIIAIANVPGMLDGTTRKLNIGVGDLEVRKDDQGVVNLLSEGRPIVNTNGTPVDFTDDIKLMSYIASKLNPR